MKKIAIIVLFIILCIDVQPLLANEAASKYKRAIKEAQSGRYEFALMYHRDIIRHHQNSKFRAHSLFAQAQYYFNQKKYNESTESFEQFLIQSKKPKEYFFALAYLYKIAQKNDEKKKSNELKKRIVTHEQLGLVFKKERTYKYLTPMNQQLKAIIKIDKIEFYKNEELFVHINY